MTQQQTQQRPPQHQDQQPGIQSEMRPQPETSDPRQAGSGKLDGKVALITGGDSGIGHAVAVAFAREGADVAVMYLSEEGDARETQRLVAEEGHEALLCAGEVAAAHACRAAVEAAVERFGRLDVLVNNAGEQHPQPSIEEIAPEQLERTFRTNVFGQFYMTQAALPHLEEGAAIINTTSVTAYKGSPGLIDYSATKGAIVSFTRSLALSLAERKIRVNAVAPGPIWTPLIPSTFPADEVATFGADVPMKRAGEPEQVAPSFVFLASDDSSYMTGQVLHPNGGTIVES
jgi:NAD(P)-dependent dehydrogenase (short-subunit alcohol dehydrogenase family)